MFGPDDLDPFTEIGRATIVDVLTVPVVMDGLLRELGQAAGSAVDEPLLSDQRAVSIVEWLKDGDERPFPEEVGLDRLTCSLRHAATLRLLARVWTEAN